jgi:non-ribosomal peptide synthetase component F
MKDCTFSYVSGSSTSPLLGVTIGAHFDWAVARWPNKEALVVSHQNVRWSFSDLANHVDRFAKGLVALGLRRGDRLGIWSPRLSETAIPIRNRQLIELIGGERGTRTLDPGIMSAPPK